VPNGAQLAVLDFGGGTCDVAVVRREPRGFVLVGRPSRLDGLGGVNLDDVVFEQVRTQLGARWDALDTDDPDTLAAVAALRRTCTAAKERLTVVDEVTIPVTLPGVQALVSLERERFEELIRPAVEEAVELLARVLERLAAPVAPTILLVGGSSRIPLLAGLVTARTGLAAVVHDDPAAAVAAGAALAARPAGSDQLATTFRTVMIMPADLAEATEPVVGEPEAADAGLADLTAPTPDRPLPAPAPRDPEVTSTVPAFTPPAGRWAYLPAPVALVAALVAAAVLIGGLIQVYLVGIVPNLENKAAAETMPSVISTAPAKPAPESSQPPSTFPDLVQQPESPPQPPPQRDEAPADAEPEQQTRAPRPTQSAPPPPPPAPERPTQPAPTTQPLRPAPTSQPPATTPDEDEDDDDLDLFPEDDDEPAAENRSPGSTQPTSASPAGQQPSGGSGPA
jgi:cell division ATPase FtsA